MTLFIKRRLDDGSEVISDSHDDAYEVVLPKGKTMELGWDRSRVDVWLDANRENAPAQADTAATDRNDAGGPGADAQKGNP